MHNGGGGYISLTCPSEEGGRWEKWRQGVGGLRLRGTALADAVTPAHRPPLMEQKRWGPNVAPGGYIVLVSPWRPDGR